MGQAAKECEEMLYSDTFSKARLIGKAMPFRDGCSELAMFAFQLVYSVCKIPNARVVGVEKPAEMN